MGLIIGNGIGIPFNKNQISWQKYCTPQNVVATATLDDTVVLTWDAVDEAESYKIYYGTDGVTFGSNTTSSTNGKTVTGLTAATKYYFKVVSVKGASESNDSDTKDATTFTAYYVRPSGGDYGDEDGSSYANAWNGFTNIAWASLGAGKVLYICGTHTEALTVGASGSEAAHLVFRGDYPEDAGVIDGTDSIATTVAVTLKNYTEWHHLNISQATVSCINFAGGTHWMYDCTINDSGDQNVETNTNANVTLTRCEMFNAVDDGISMHSGARVILIDCYLHDNDQNIQSSGGAALTAIGTRFYANGSLNVGTDFAGTILSRCKFYGSSAVNITGTISYCLFDTRTAGIASILGGGSKTVNNCTMIGTNTGRITVPNSTTTTLNNCIIMGLNMVAYVPGDGVLNANNCNFYNTYKTGIDSNIGEIVGDPKFTNLAGNDFTLAADSPCRGAGVTGLGYTTDYAGNPVPATGIDVGCYQCS